MGNWGNGVFSVFRFVLDCYFDFTAALVGLLLLPARQVLLFFDSAGHLIWIGLAG
jgi:hypothetical protein